VLTANDPVKPLASGIARLVVEGIDGKPLIVKLQDVQHLPLVPVNLLSGQLFEKRTGRGYLNQGALYTSSGKPVARTETTRYKHFPKVKELKHIPKATSQEDIANEGRRSSDIVFLSLAVSTTLNSFNIIDTLILDYDLRN
jgi:hypothetical protein